MSSALLDAETDDELRGSILSKASLLSVANALAIEGIFSAPSSNGSDEANLLCSSSSSSGSVSPNESSVTAITTAALLESAKLMGAQVATPETLKKGNKHLHMCPHCNFSTYMSQHMKSHLEAHERHQGQMYQCDICQMQFSQKANMHRHRMRHSGVKPYECRYCKKRFFRKDQMQEHSMTHIKTGADFDCPVSGCASQFSQHAALRAHLDDNHTITSSHPASCKRCSLLFANSRRLLLHYQTKHDEGDGSGLSAGECSPPSASPTKKRRLSPLASATAAALFSTSKEDRVRSDREIKSEHAIKVEDDVKSEGSSSPVPYMQTSSVMNTLASQFGGSSSSAVALLQQRLEELAKMNAMGLPGMEATNAMLLQQLIPQHIAAAAAAAAGAKHREQQSSSSAYQLSNEDLLLALSSQANSSVFNMDNLSTATSSTKESGLQLWSGEAQSAFVASSDEQSHSPSMDSAHSVTERDDEDSTKEDQECTHCDICFKDKTLYVLHKGLHSEGDPFQCNLCGKQCKDRYLFTTHIISADHST